MSITLINKTPKVNYYGIEVDPEITWNGWEPGNKYTKKLILKNVKFVTQKLNFSVPAKEVFTTTFPKTITLSAGTSFCLPITFRPHKKDVFEDKIDFQTTDGEVFTVPVKALLPEYQIEMPEKMSCGIVAPHDTANKVFVVTNKSELETAFKWCFAVPYEIEPSEGVLQPFESRKFTVHFRPEDVSTYQMSIPLLYGDIDGNMRHQKLLTVTSVAKYPNISILVDDQDFTGITNEDGQIVVDFGTVAVGSRSVKQIRIENISEVNTSVEIFRDNFTNPIDWVFSCPIEFHPIPAGTRVETSRKSVIKPHKLLIPFEYYPKISFTDYVENFIVKVSNKCATFKVKCIGKADGPSVVVSHTFLNFFQLNLGEVATQLIILTNNSQLTAVPFQFVIDPSISVFHIDKCNGIIKPQDKCHIVVTFRPQNPIQYYRKIACLVSDQEPIFIDILGTCHDMYTQPHILQLKHLKNFRQRQIDGLSYFSPEILNIYVQKNFLKVNEDNHLTVINEEIESLREKIPLLNNWKEYFFSNNDTDVVFSTPYIGQDQYSIYFEGLDYISKKQIHQRLLAGTLDSSDVKNINEREKKFSLKNNTKGTITIQWTNLPESIRKDVFSITPLKMDISPQETVIFTVKFSPDGSNRIYGAELEAFGYFKSQRQFELAKEEFISPPFCVVLRCTGHSFAKNQENFLPKFQFDRAQVVFPSVNLNETAFRSLTLTNKGEEPMIFNLQKLSESFSVKPLLGQILPGDQQIFVVRFEPLAIRQYSGSVEMQLNSRPDFVQAIPVLGSTDKAIVSMDNDSQIFFSPTNIGNISSQRYSIKNTSRIPLKFEWKLRPTDTFVVRVYPQNGLLLPNEILTQQWFFSPNVRGRIIIKALLTVQGISPSGSLTDPQYFTLRIIGQAEEANLAVGGSNHLGFEPLVVGSSAFKSFCLMNSSEATVYYQLYVNRISPIIDESGSCGFNRNDNTADETDDIKDCVKIKDSKGVLPGRCTKIIYVSVSPKQRRSYKLQIGYSLIDNDFLEMDYMKRGNSESKNLTNRINVSNDNLVTVSMTGVFPTLQITDVQGTGPSQWLSKLNLWKNLSLDNFNVCLDSDPTTSELIFTMGTRASQFRPVPVATRALIDMNIGAAPHNSDPTEIRLMFENCGSVETKLAFLFPQDLEIELEYWAETGEYTEEELHQMKIRDNSLFDIQPRKATVKVGESVTVCITYNHWVVGTDRFPVLLKLDHGRELLLNLTGVTLHLERPYIHFPNNKHLFNPTPIGLLKTPIQYYDLYNPSAAVVHFELDLSPLQKLMEENYNIPILQCLNPVGDILPGQTFRLEWAFIPIEPKTYIVEVPFHISDSACLKVQFTAIGYDQRYLGGSINPDQSLPGESGVPSVQSIALPNQDAKLSIERISLGNVPTFVCLRRVVFLNNISTTRNITFSWNVTNSEDANYIYVYPQNGVLPAKESILCHITLYTRNVPKFFEFNLICEIYDQSKITEFHIELNKWEEEEKRRNVEFTISDVGKHQSNMKKYLNGKQMISETKKSSTPSYLPPVIKPISSQSNGQQRNISSSTQKSALSSEKSFSELKDNSLWFKPRMPKPFLLHLGITGRSCNIEEYQKDYPESYSRYCLDKPFMMETACPLSVLQSEESSPHFPIDANLKEHVVMELVFSDILGAIIEDAEFLNAVKNIREEAIPFYSQLPGARAAHQFDDQEHLDDYADNRDIFSASPEFEGTINESAQSITKKSQIIESGSNQSPRLSIESKRPLDEQTILDSLSFGTMIESVMENMIVNILSEANAKEVDLTCRPRLIALPPRLARQSCHDNYTDNDSAVKNKQ